MPRYTPAAIEPKWQAFWEASQTFKSPEMPTSEKLYVLDMFPYPSGAGLHVGHPEGYTATDIVCRYARMCGKSVLHPMGFDAFGLPAEEHAIKTNTPPRINTEQNIAEFTRQLKELGFSYDWSRVLATTDVEYFRWTQWIFLVLFDTWFDADQQRGRPISELPIPGDISGQGEEAIRKYQDEHRLAFQSDALVNWCPGLGTVLANEEVIDGKSERGGHPVQRIPLRQWMLRITSYAERLESDLEGLDWSEGIKKLQRDWIGKSVGAEVDFYIGPKTKFDAWKKSRAGQPFARKPADDVLRIYTTRPDTLFGVTYMVIAPEHPFVATLTTAEQKSAVADYCAKAASKSDRDRQDVAKAKTGVFSGSYALNPVSGQPVPIWIADYVLWGYGTGAIMAVPAHDDRDYEFAKQYGIPITAVVAPEAPAASASEKELAHYQKQISGEACYTEYGRAINSSDKYNGLTTLEFKAKITADLATDGLGREAVNYKLRDWLFSRQRFWGEPFPILHELDENLNPTGMIRAVDPADLPVDLPYLEDYKPHGRPEPPLAKAPDEWLYPTIDGKRYRRETNTMPQWAGSCWYYLRFIDPKNDQVFVDREKEKAWMPIDLYVGGAEHAVLHLLYSRFWHKVLFDRGYVSTKEPFQKLVNQGMILGEVELTSYQTAGGTYISSADVRELEDGTFVTKSTGEAVSAVRVETSQVMKQGEHTVLVDHPSVRVESRAFKMSKSRGNVINPSTVIAEYGADSLRLYEMFMGPLEATKPWSMAGVSGVRSFLDRVWRLMIDDRVDEMQLLEAVQDVEPTQEQLRLLHKTIKQVTYDLEHMQFNTSIARMMEFTNFFTKEKVRPRSVMEKFVLLLSPLAPHIAEELWHMLGNKHSLAYEPWPKFDDALTRDAEVEIPVQILGKLRSKVVVAAGSDQETLIAAAKADPRIIELLTGKEIVKTIVVPGKLINFVVKG